MRKSLSLLAFVVLGAAMMYGQASRTWVSGVGDDANPCSRTAPCKTFAGAISKTAPGGEIDALDPGGFGALTITKAITLDGGGGQVASVLVAGTNGIVVAAGANDNVIIRNLRLNGINQSGNGGLNGISFLSGHDLNVENCVIFGFNNNGVNIALGASASAHIINTVIKNIGGVGIRAATTAGVVTVGVENSVVVPLGTGAGNIGIEAAQHAHVVVNDSVVQSAGGDGMKADDAATADAQMTVVNSESSFNGANGLEAATTSFVGVGGSTFVGNATCGINNTAGGANLFSFTPGGSAANGTNRGFNNPNNVCGAVTQTAQF